MKSLSTKVVVAFINVILLLVIGTVVYEYLEDWNWTEALYFSTATLTTVGYGDLHPTTDASRVFTVAYMLVGTTIAVGSISVVGLAYLEERGDRLVKRRKGKQTKKSE